MSATAQNDRVNFLTLEDINANVVDTFNKSSEVMRRVVSRPEPFNGRVFQSPITTTTSSLGKSFKGVEAFDTSVDFAPQNMTWYPTGYAQPVGVSLVEKSINQTPAGKIDLYKASWEYAQNSLITNMGTIFYGYGLGNDFDGAGVIVDDGTNTSTYAGLTRATYPSINCGGSTGIEVAASGLLTLALMGSADDASTISGAEAETSNMVMANQTVFSLYEALLLPTTRSTYQAVGGAWNNGGTNVNGNANQTSGLHLQSGATSLDYRGKAIIRDQKSPSGDMWFWNEKWWRFKSLSIDGLNTVATTEGATTGAYDNYKVSAVQFREMMQPINALSEVGIFVMYGQLVCLNPNRNELITGITTS
jgi:hypothetical protein